MKKKPKGEPVLADPVNEDQGDANMTLYLETCHHCGTKTENIYFHARQCPGTPQTAEAVLALIQRPYDPRVIDAMRMRHDRA